MRNSLFKVLIKVVLAIFIFTTSCNSSEEKKIYNNNDTLKVDTSVIAILPFDTAKSWVFKPYGDDKDLVINSLQATELSNEDLQKIETILSKCITDYNQKGKVEFEKNKKNHPEVKLDLNSYIIDLHRYKRQYIAAINLKGQKEVWVNCFCNTWNSNWQKNIFIVKDGGNCYFNLNINLSTGQYYDFIVNGDA